MIVRPFLSIITALKVHHSKRSSPCVHLSIVEGTVMCRHHFDIFCVYFIGKVKSV